MARRKLSPKKTKSQSPRKQRYSEDHDQDDVQAMLQKKLRVPYRYSNAVNRNNGGDHYGSPERGHYGQTNDDLQNVVPFTPERDIYTKSIRPYQAPTDSLSSPKRNKNSVKSSKNNRKKLNFFGDDEEEEDEYNYDYDDGNYLNRDYMQKGAPIDFVDE